MVKYPLQPIPRTSLFVRIEKLIEEKTKENERFNAVLVTRDVWFKFQNEVAESRVAAGVWRDHLPLFPFTNEFNGLHLILIEGGVDFVFLANILR